MREEEVSVCVWGAGGWVGGREEGSRTAWRALAGLQGLEPPAPSASFLSCFQFRDRSQLEALRELVSSAPFCR